MNSRRVASIDVMRGLTLALMIVVNMSFGPPVAYDQLDHAAWNGLTLTDLVFPTFLFVVGASMALTLPRLESMDDGAFVARVARRSALIFACGFLLYWFPFFTTDAAGHLVPKALADLRILGVLQRIALCYAVAALLVRFGGRAVAACVAVAILLAYGFVLLHFGDLSLQGNAVLKLDLLLFGPRHLYHGEVVDGARVAFDPEGLLSTLPAIANTVGGYLAGDWLLRRGRTARSLLGLAAVGACLVLVAVAFREVLPFNKKLWTPPYALCAIGCDLVLLAVLAWAIDLAGWRAGTGVFSLLGRNTLAIYLFSEVGNGMLWRIELGPPGEDRSLMHWLHVQVFEPLAGARNGALLEAIAWLAVCVLVARFLDRRGIYLRA